MKSLFHKKPHLGESHKFQFTAVIHKVDFFPGANVKVPALPGQIVWSRGAKVASTRAVDTFGSGYAWEQELVVLSTLFKEKGGYGEKKSKFALVMVDPSNNKKTQTYAKVKINLAHHALRAAAEPYKEELRLVMKDNSKKKEICVLILTLGARWLKDYSRDTCSIASGLSDLSVDSELSESEENIATELPSFPKKNNGSSSNSSNNNNNNNNEDIVKLSAVFESGELEAANESMERISSPVKKQQEIQPALVPQSPTITTEAAEAEALWARMRKRVEQAEQSKDKYKAKLDAAKAKLKAARISEDRARREQQNDAIARAEASAEAEKLREIVGDLERKIVMMANDKNAGESAYKEIEEQRTRFEEMRLKLEGEKSRLEEQCGLMSREIQNLELRCKAVAQVTHEHEEEQIVEIKQKLESVKADNADLKVRLMAAQKIGEEQGNRATSLEREVKETKERFEEDIKHLENERRGLQAQLMELLSGQEGKDESAQATCGIIQELEATLQSTRSQYAETRKTMEDMLQKLKKDKDRLKAELRASRTECETLKDQLDAETAKFSKKMAKIEETIAVEYEKKDNVLIEELKQRLVALDSDRSALNAANVRLQTQLQRRKDQNIKLAESLTRAEVELLQGDEKYHRIEAEIEERLAQAFVPVICDLEVQLNEAKEKLAQYQNKK